MVPVGVIGVHVNTSEAPIIMREDVSLFAGLDKAEREFLAVHAVTRVFPKHSIIINEGDTSDALYVVVSGRVKAYLSDEQGKEIILNTHGPGEYFGEMALFGQERRPATTRAIRQTRLLPLTRTSLLERIRQDPVFAAGGRASGSGADASGVHYQRGPERPWHTDDAQPCGGDHW